MIFVKASPKRKPEKGRPLTRKHTTPRLQVIRPVGGGHELDSYGVIYVSEREALMGARKMVNIAHGPGKRTFLLTIPPSTPDGGTLRLRGMGRRTRDGLRGDLYLKVQVRD
jgi:hypothetical protein